MGQVRGWGSDLGGGGGVEGFGAGGGGEGAEAKGLGEAAGAKGLGGAEGANGFEDDDAIANGLLFAADGVANGFDEDGANGLALVVDVAPPPLVVGPPKMRLPSCTFPCSFFSSSTTANSSCSSSSTQS